ncbi:MAG TPA: lipid-binding SYLF domain-containing protein [Terracidiphilus sp.]|jgi:lipid-binding SYLF domain-containing protein|nr:lipid-binding SYLF domain-containing protein [Terracidiphilus sp.]
MKKIIAVCTLLVAAGASAFADDIGKLDKRLDNARLTIDEIMSTPDHKVPDSIARDAVCIGVVPGMVKGAFIFGAEYGQGVVTCRTGHGWSAPVFIRMAGGSFGFQAGGQGTDLVLVAVNDKGFQDLLRDKFKIGGDASAAAGPVGRDAQAATDWKLRAELLTWSRTHGIFAGIDLNGVGVSQNREDTDVLYGGPHPFEQILHGEVAPPAVARPFLHAVAQYFGSARMSH